MIIHIVLSVATVTSTESFCKYVSLDVEEAGKEPFLSGRGFLDLVCLLCKSCILGQ